MAEVYEEAGLADELSVQQLPDRWLFASLDGLRRQYPEQLHVRWVSPYSLLGLYVAIRFRIRTYPTVIIGSTPLRSLAGPKEFEEQIVELIETEKPNTENT